MKRLLCLSLLAGLLSLVACSKSSDSGNSSSAGGASTPQACNGVYQDPNCQYYQSYYNQQEFHSWQYGAWYWPQPYQPNVGQCGCQSGFLPVQGPFGTACAPVAYFSSYTLVYRSVGYWGGSYGPYWNYPQNGGYINAPQQVYTPPNGTNSCLQSTAQGCDVRLNNCSGGARCQPVAGGSTIGLCVR